MSIFDADVEDSVIEKFKAMSHDELLNALEVCKESRPELALVIYVEIYQKYTDERIKRRQAIGFTNLLNTAWNTMHQRRKCNYFARS